MPESSVPRAIADARTRLQEIYGYSLRGLYLYGSYARGEATVVSDLDLLVVLERVDSYFAEIERTSELRSDLSLEYGLTVSMVYVSDADWRTADTPFLASVRVEARAA
ncbi:MAG TPA: nucleotidyltransferase domain-containing protein [Gemmatimonadaceae bacterium]|nr:nucleotidyltransferase domain-containing protein [Gemmatimonadaceae bacterium]